jgi:uridine kinase
MTTPVVPMTKAVETILAMLPRGTHPHVVVGITGPVGSGKSHLASLLSPCVLSSDDYLPDYQHIPEQRRDLPELADYASLGRDLSHLRRGIPRDIPVWSFQTHRRESSRRVAPHPLIVCEGIHALHDLVVPSVDLRVFVEAPASVRWSRWEHLEQTGVRGWGVEKARNFFHGVADPTFERYAATYRAMAHLVVVNDAWRPAGGVTERA